MVTDRRIQEYWDADAATYDRSGHHRFRSAAERAAWSAFMVDALPSAPVRVLDVGAGTGFLSLIAAELGHHVTALDVSASMLSELRNKALDRGLNVDVIEGSADTPPDGPFDVVMERHLMWTLPDPGGAIVAWRGVAAPEGLLLVCESIWGQTDRTEVYRHWGREVMRRLRKVPADHHEKYSSDMNASLPLVSGTSPAAVVELVEGAGWGKVRLYRMCDVEWASTLNVSLVERALGIPPRFAILGTAGP